MSEYINFKEYLNDGTTNKEPVSKPDSTFKQNTNIPSNTTIITANEYQTYSQGVIAAINDKSSIRWKTFFISIPLGLFPWIFGLLGWNSIPDKYIAKNCSYEFIKGYKSKKRGLKFLPSLLCWLIFTNIFYIFLYIVLIQNM